jgi:16S rRNA (cytosine1402-N4)-methyltransferase
MNKRAGQTAADILNNYTEEQLAGVLYLYGELKNARRLAKAIVNYRNNQRIETTGELLTALSIDAKQENSQLSIVNSQLKKDIARLYQALRIEVNHEMDALRDMLKGGTELLNKGGRLSVITYHSLEDRIVKNVMKAGNVEGKIEQDFYGRISSPYRVVGKMITPSQEEQERNTRSRSAKLRIAEKI